MDGSPVSVTAERRHCAQNKLLEMPLGHFEQLVLSAVTSLRGNAYGGTIHAKVSELAGRSVNLGSIYVTLDRLQDKGLVTSWFGAPTPERGGKPKRYYR